MSAQKADLSEGSVSRRTKQFYGFITEDLVGAFGGVAAKMLGLKSEGDDEDSSSPRRSSVARKAAQLSALQEANKMCANDEHDVPEPPDLRQMLDERQLEEITLKTAAKLASGLTAKHVAQEKVSQIKVIKTAKFDSTPSGGSVFSDELDEDEDEESSEAGGGGSSNTMLKTGIIRKDARPRPLQGGHPEHPYECLVFKGGGAKGAIYPGAIKALEDAGIMPYVKRFAGASAGALVAALLAAGLSSDQLYFELATTDLHGLVLDRKGKMKQASDLFSKFGLHPAKALYRHLGLLFHRYLGFADITFGQLYEHFGVELAIAVTNISRASVELLHVKTAPNYPIRKAVRMSMSLPLALHPCRDSNIHSVINDDVMRMERELEKSGIGMGLPKPPAGDEDAFQDAQTQEYYVDGGVLNNYPIDSFDGWWLSMDKEDNFFRKIIGLGGHKNYVERFGAYDEETGAKKVNPKTLGFRLDSVDEPDALHQRMGNDALELKVRETAAARLPTTPLGLKYAERRNEVTRHAKERLQLQQGLRDTMTWIKEVRDAAIAEESLTTPTKNGKSAAMEDDHASLCAQLEKALNRQHSSKEAEKGAKELFTVLGISSIKDLVDLLRHHHNHRNTVSDRQARTEAMVAGRATTAAELQEAIKKSKFAEAQIKGIYSRTELSEDARLLAIQSIVASATKGSLPTMVEACDELEELLEVKGSDVMKRLCGMEPKDISGVAGFVNRMIEAIQMTNDERTQTKQNYSRTCMLNTEYVGTMDFKLEDGDYKFLWNKGYMLTRFWLEKRTKKSKDKKKKVAKAIAVELKAQAKQIKEEEKTPSQHAPTVANGTPAKAQPPEPLLNTPSGLFSQPTPLPQPTPPGASRGIRSWVFPDPPSKPPATEPPTTEAPQAAADEKPALDTSAEVKAKLQKVLDNKTLKDSEKLDIIARHLAAL